MFNFPEQREKLEQGITFSITGQCGYSSAPNKTDEGMYTVGNFFDAATDTPQGSGSVMMIGHTVLRLAVIGSEKRAPTSSELEKMKALTREAMEAGALGMSFGLFYAPGCYATVDECVALARVVAEYDGMIAAHIRDEGDGVCDAVEEFLEIIKRSGARAVFSHHKSWEMRNWGKVRTTLKMIDEAVLDGCEIHQDVYPYSACETTLLATFIPQKFHKAGSGDVIALLRDEGSRAEIKEWNIKNNGKKLDWVLVSKCPPYTEYQGMTLDKIAEAMGYEDGYDCAFELIERSEGVAEGFFFIMCEEDIEYVMAHPRTMICTDSTVAGKSERFHPRLRSSFPRAIAEYTRNRGVCSLPEMIRKMTSLPASVYRLHGKGLINVGMDADICIFDYEKIKDGATYDDCRIANEGIRYVLVGGEIVLENGIANGKRRAAVLRMPFSER